MPSRTAARNVSLTVVAQGLSSVTNFAAGALALTAAGGDLGSFGEFAIAFQLCQIVITVGQSSTGSAVLIHGARDDDGRDALRGGAAAAALLTGLAAGTALLLAGVIAGGGLRRPLVTAGLGAAALTTQYTMRAARFADRDPVGVIRADGIWLLVVLAAAAGDLTDAWDPVPADYLAVWLIGAAISAAPYLALAVGAGRHRLGHFWRVTGPQAVRTGADGLLARSVFVVTLISAQAVVDSEASGALAAAVLVFSPMSVVHASALAVVVPGEVTRRGIHVPALRIPLRVFAAISAITVGWAGALLLIDRSPLGVGPFDLDAAGVTAALFIATFLRFLAMGFWRGPVVALRVADAASESLRARAIGTLLQWIFPVIGLVVASTEGGAFGLALATWVGASVAWAQYLRLR